MNTFSSMLKFYFKNIFLCLSTVVVFLGMPIGLLAYYMSWRATMAPLFFLTVTMMAGVYFPIFFMFVSHEFFYKVKAVHLAECARGVHKGLLKIYASQLGVLLCINFMITLMVTLVNVFAYFDMQIQSPAYFVHILASIGTHIFLVGAVGIFVGLAASLLKKRLYAYLLLVLFAVVGSGALSSIFIGLYNGTGIDFFPILDLFAVKAPSLNFTSNTHFGISLLSYQFQRIGFWCFGILALALFSVGRHKKWQRTVACVCVALCLTSLTFYFLPASKVEMTRRHPRGSSGEQIYRNKSPLVQEEDGGFAVTKYDLDLNPGRQLTVKATLDVNQPKLETYKFTLYYGYRVKDVKNQADTPLQFTQEGDYIAVERGDTPITQIKLTYSGSSPQFYANRQGMYLTGQFPYYPHSGYHAVYNTSNHSLQPFLLPKDTQFRVRVRTNKEVFSNLKLGTDGTYSGQADSATFMSGFLKQQEIKGIQVIYPYLETEEYSDALLKEHVDTFLREKKEDTTCRQIFLTPNVNLGVISAFAAFSDYFVALQMFDLNDCYERFVIPKPKKSLYDCINNYQNNYERYNDHVKRQKGPNMPSNQSEDIKQLLLFDDTLQMVGESVLIPATKAYLEDDNDTRAPAEFLNALQQEKR